MSAPHEQARPAPPHAALGLPAPPHPKLVIAVDPFDRDRRGLARALEGAGARVHFAPAAARGDRQALSAALEGAQALIAASRVRIDEALLDAHPQLRLVARPGVGLDDVAVEAARSRGVRVTYTPGANAAAVAELTLGLVLNLTRGISAADRSMAAGSWDRVRGPQLSALTLGLLGLGRVGRQVAARFRALGCRVLACDIRPDARVAKQLGVRLVDEEQLLVESDVLSLHAPLTRATRSWLSPERLAAMRSGSYLVNTARGELVPAAALLRALDSGRLAGAALDVHESEPYCGPLAGHPRTLLTAHMGASTPSARRAMEGRAALEVLRWMKGRPARHLAPTAAELEAGGIDPGRHKNEG